MKRKIFFPIILTISLLLLVSGCRHKNVSKNNWQNEVGLAHQCGEEGLQCCADRQPSCFYNLVCCQDPNDPTHTECRENCHCGSEGDFCCAGNVCDKGLACWQGKCQKCGGKNQPCCAGDQPCASSSLACANGLCVACGIAGNPCCQASSSLPCLTQKARDNTRTECQSNICVPCGFDGKPACHTQPFCLPGHLFNNNVCYPCGDYNQPCCNEKAQGYQCDRAQNLVCQLGFCSPATTSKNYEH